MTRLFLKFYLGVIIILVLMALIQMNAEWVGDSAKNQESFVQTLFGPCQWAQAQMNRASPEEYDSIVADMTESYGYPVRVLDHDSPELVGWPENVPVSDPAFFSRRMYGVAFGDNSQFLAFGPLPEFAGPRLGLMGAGVIAVLILAALAIAFLLRPIVRQLKAVDQVATEITNGNLAARIEDLGALDSLPFAEAFNRMAAKNESMLKSQRELLQSVSHELRTPLARIRFATELIDSASTHEQRKVRLASVDRATEELDGLVGELLTYVRFDAETAFTDIETFELGTILFEIGDSFKTFHPKLAIEVNCPDRLSVETNRSGLTRAIGNLVGNACKYAITKVRMTAFSSADSICIQIDDDGCGIDSSEWERVFEPFVRLDDRSAAEGESGVGLGLALVNRIVIRLKGKVRVLDSDLGGARFEIQIPHDFST